VTVDPKAGVDCSQWMTEFVIGDCGIAKGGLMRNPVSGVNTCGAASVSFGDALMVKCVWVFGMLEVVATPASVSFGDVVIDTVTSGFCARNRVVPIQRQSFTAGGVTGALRVPLVPEVEYDSAARSSASKPELLSYPS
jgi:hypothetical protein